MKRAIIFALFFQFANAAYAAKLTVLSELGSYVSPDGNFSVKITTDTLGGGKVLQLNNEVVAIDITQIAWTSRSLLVYGVSPVYGKPGIYLRNCEKSNSKIIVKPLNKNEFYPDGADYFEIDSIVERENDLQITYFYVGDVDSKEFEKLKSERNKRTTVVVKRQTD